MALSERHSTNVVFVCVFYGHVKVAEKAVPTQFCIFTTGSACNGLL